VNKFENQKKLGGSRQLKIYVYWNRWKYKNYEFWKRENCNKHKC